MIFERELCYTLTAIFLHPTVFGKDYDPFATTVKEGLHPLPAFMRHHQSKIRNFYLGLIYIIPTFVLGLMLHWTQKLVFKRVHGAMKN